MRHRDRNRKKLNKVTDIAEQPHSRQRERERETGEERERGETETQTR